MVKGGHFRCPLFFTSFWAAIEVVPKAQIRFKGQGVPQIENGAYTSVREYFNLRDNAAIGPEMGFWCHF